LFKSWYPNLYVCSIVKLYKEVAKTGATEGLL